MLFVQWLSELNLFETNATDEHSVRLQRWSTRLYIVVLIFALCILSIYASWHVITRRFEIEHPTLDVYEQLQDKYSTECPCSDVSIPYGKFVQLVPSYHQVCSSDFVTQQWIDYLFDPATTPFYFNVDFRSSASQQFQLLASLCLLSAQGIQDSLRSFANTELITGTLLSKALLLAEMGADIEAFKVNTPDAFNNILLFIRNFIVGNSLMPATRDFVFFYLNQSSSDQSWHIVLGSNSFLQPNSTPCDCARMPTCQGLAGFFGDVMIENKTGYYAYLDVVDGWYAGCSPIDSLLLSTLKIFYNQTALNSVLHFFSNSSTNFTCLDAKQSTIFDPRNTTIETLVTSSFVEQWTENINYSSYFDLCAPQSCAYTVNQHFNILYIITTVLGLYGGLSIVLHITIPIIIHFVFRRQQETPAPTTISIRLKTFSRALFKLNLFKSAIHVEPVDIYQQQWSTRLYILLLSLALAILTLYTTVSVDTTQIDLIDPSLDTVLHLQQRSGLSSLQCPCSQLSASLKQFVELTPTYHEVCSSDFVSEYWIDSFGDPYIFNWTDFRQSGPVFRLLQSFCEIANRTVNNALNLFYETQLVTTNLLTPDHFMSQMMSSANYFQLVTPNQFSYPLQLMRETTLNNQFISSVGINYEFIFYNDTGRLEVRLRAYDVIMDISGLSCSDILSRDCKQQIFIYQFKNVTELAVPGFYVSFYIVESLLLSQVLFLYNQSNVNYMAISINLNSFHNFTALSRPSRFSINSTFASLSNNLFIESWMQTFNFAAYFEQCQPYSCSYTVSQRPTLVSVITTVVSLFGGLSVFLRFVSSWIVAFILSHCTRQTQQEDSSEISQGESKENSKHNIRFKNLWKMSSLIFPLQNVGSA